MNTKTLSENSTGLVGFVSRNMKRLTFALAPLTLALASFGCKDNLDKDADLATAFPLLQVLSSNTGGNCSAGNLFPYNLQGTVHNSDRMAVTTTSNTILILDQGKNSGGIINTINPASGNCNTLGGIGRLNSNSGDLFYFGCSGSSNGIIGTVDPYTANAGSVYVNTNLSSLGSAVNVAIDESSKLVLAGNGYNQKMIMFAPDNAATFYASSAIYTGISDIAVAQLDPNYSTDHDLNKSTSYVGYSSGVNYTKLSLGTPNFNLGTVSALSQIQNNLTNAVWYDCPGTSKILLTMNTSNHLMAFNINGDGNVNNLAHSHIATFTTSPASNQVSQIIVYGNKLYIISSGINGSSDGVMVVSMEDIKAGIDPFTSSKSKFILDSSFANPIDAWINPRTGLMYVTNGGGTNKVTVIDTATDTVVGTKSIAFPTRRVTGLPFN